jgi:hypothetical protein
LSAGDVPFVGWAAGCFGLGAAGLLAQRCPGLETADKIRRSG